jgi:hypothetical protein
LSLRGFGRELLLFWLGLVRFVVEVGDLRRLAERWKIMLLYC